MDTNGSEHTIDGVEYAAEVHFVHRNVKYGTDKFLEHGDGALVIGVFIKKGVIQMLLNVNVIENCYSS